jgi:putative spermidine/putrescine transport system permease protein
MSRILTDHLRVLKLIGAEVIHITLFFIFPLVTLFLISVSIYSPGTGVKPAFVFDNYKKFIMDPYYRGIIIETLKLGFIVTFLTALLGYPLAYLLMECKNVKVKGLLYLLVLAPLLISTVVRTYGWMIILGNKGILNNILLYLGLINEPIKIMYTFLGVVIGLTQVNLPYMVLSLHSVLESIDKTLVEAAQSLGAKGWKTFFLIILPLSIPGILSGSIVVFVLCIGAFVTPILLGGPTNKVISMVVYEQALQLLNWPFASANSFILLILIGVLLVVYNKLLMSKRYFEK